MDVDKGILKDIEFFGDFFDYGNLDTLSERLRGCSIQRDALVSVFTHDPPGSYIRGLSAEELADLITEG